LSRPNSMNGVRIPPRRGLLTGAADRASSTSPSPCKTERPMRGRTIVAAALAACLAAGAARGADEEGSKDEGGRKEFSLGVRGGPWLGFFDGTVRYPVNFQTGPFTGAGKFSSHVNDTEVLPYGEAFLTLKYFALYAEAW